MRRFGLMLIASVYLCGCGGVEVDTLEGEQTRSEVLTFFTDDKNALISNECVGRLGLESCARYPNPMACESMDAVVAPDGNVCATCTLGEGQVEEVCGGPMDGVPFTCQVNPDSGCRVCLDVFGVPVVDECNANTALYDRKANKRWSVAAGAVDTAEVATRTRALGGKGMWTCNPLNMMKIFVLDANYAMNREGIPITFKPDFSKLANATKYWGYFYKTFGNPKFCSMWNFKPPKWMVKCWNEMNEGNCFCLEKYQGNKKLSCRCGRFGVLALRMACNLTLHYCNNATHIQGLLADLYGHYIQWIFKLGLLNCLGTPLALDLDGGGVATTSRAGGVTFDLLGVGPMKTAWVGPGDALLVMDRDGNGRIDGGAELFGETSNQGLVPAGDGFQVLAELDSPAMGGNGNGRVEAGDLFFSQLELWQDRNTDGISQPGELMSLADAGVTSLETRGRRSCGMVKDANGNDQSLRASFTRADGTRGLLVDVLFQGGE